MTKRTTSNPKLAEMQASLSGQIDSMRTQAVAEIAQFDQVIITKHDELSELAASVCLEDAAALIEEKILEVLQPARDTLSRSLAQAVQVDAYAEIQTCGGTSSDGTARFYQPSQRRLTVLDHYTNPIDVLAMLWTDADIKQWALTQATKMGAKSLAKGGLRSADAIAQHQALAIEVVDLHAARKVMREAVAGLVEVHPIPGYVPPPTAEPIYPTQPVVTIMRQDPDGVMRATQHGNDPFQ